MFNDDERQWPDVPIDDEPGLPDEQDELELPGEAPFEEIDIEDIPDVEDLPDEDIQEPLIDDDEMQVRESAGESSASSRQVSISKDQYEEKHSSPTDRKQ